MKNLSQAQSAKLIEQMITGSMSQSRMAKILCDLAEKGETADEIFGAVRAMRVQMQTIPTLDGAIDTCGTGGDGKGSFNISTAVAFVIAGAGVKVAKHGNRKSSSLCGSADVLEQLGVNIGLSPFDAQEVFHKVGMVFLFAPIYHTAMKYVAPVRKKLGIRTIFNYLGPFCNPAGTRRQIVGVPNLTVLERLVAVVAQLDYDCLALVSSEDGLDEVSIVSPTRVILIKGNTKEGMTIEPKKYRINHKSLSGIIGGDASENAQTIKEILLGEKGARRDIVLLNTALALYVTGKVTNIENGITLAKKSISSGNAYRILQKLIKVSNQYEKNL